MTSLTWQSATSLALLIYGLAAAISMGVAGIIHLTRVGLQRMNAKKD